MSRPGPDPQGRDEDIMEQSEMLDEDELGVDPLEAGMDPPEEWSASGRYGTTATEQATERPLTDRLNEEIPDLPAEDRGRGPADSRAAGLRGTNAG